MKHYGDITKINGKAVPSVDIITFGAPCQDLSIVGKRAGMKHQALGNQETTRSGVKPVFSSEIEEFPIAVAKKHFGDDDLGLEGDYERYL